MDIKRKAVIEDDTVVNVIRADDDYEDPKGREVIDAPHGSGIEIGRVRREGEWTHPDDHDDEEEA